MLKGEYKNQNFLIALVFPLKSLRAKQPVGGFKYTGTCVGDYCVKLFVEYCQVNLFFYVRFERRSLSEAKRAEMTSDELLKEIHGLEEKIKSLHSEIEGCKRKENDVDNQIETMEVSH